MQWSLRNLLIATAVVPVAIFAIAKSTPLYLSAVVTVAAVGWIAVAIMAWVEAGQRRAWARGMVVAATGYAILIFTLGTEIDLYGSRLATSHLLAYAYQATVGQPQQTPVQIATTTYYGVPSSTVMPAPTPYTPAPPTAPYGNVVVNSYPVQVVAVSPQPREFGTIGHVYWGVLFALVGGWFAAWIERRQKQEAEKTKTA